MLQVNDLRAVKPSLNPCPPSNCLHALATINHTLYIPQIWTPAPKSFVDGPTNIHVGRAGQSGMRYVSTALSSHSILSHRRAGAIHSHDMTR